MSKQVKFREEERDKVKAGLDIATKLVRTTLGPKGQNAFIDDKLQPKITNDGKMILNSITLKDKFENMGLWLAKNASSQTDDDAGDGTSTTTVLLEAIVAEAQKRPESVMDIKRSLLETGARVVEYIKEASTSIKKEQIASVASISSESETIGELIAEVVEEVGEKVPVKVEDNAMPRIEYEISQGLETPVGYADPAFINDIRNGTCELENVAVFATDHKISSLPDLTVFLEMLKTNQLSNIVMLVADIDASVQGIFVNSKHMGTMNPLIIHARNADLDDMVAMSGATLISEKTGLKLSDVKLEHLGTVKKIVVGSRKTVIVNDSPLAKEQAEKLRAMAEETKNMYEKQFISDRADRLTGGIAVIKVGANVDIEREYQKYKIEDAINATKSALDEGIVEGGGMCLYRISNKFKGNSIGEAILRNALKAPLKAIIENCDEDYTAVIKKMTRNKGYDAKENKMVDMIESGIIDPAKVTRCAFENALETASNYITMSVCIADDEEEEEKQIPRQ